ncbi:MAG: hypothetical protein ACTSYI_10895 [Promethearchaeota archaeon]
MNQSITRLCLWLLRIHCIHRNLDRTGFGKICLDEGNILVDLLRTFGENRIIANK